MKLYKDPVIKCPNCNCSYLPAEIYYPQQFLGRPKDIERLDNGEIDTYFGKSMDLVEHFECEKCGAHFKVIGNIRFSTYRENNLDFNSEYVTKLNSDKLYFNEE